MMKRRGTTRLAVTILAALSATIFLTGASSADRPDRPPTPLHGAWSYSHSDSQDGSSWSKSLSVSQNAGAGDANIKVEEMVNGVTHTRHQSHVSSKNVSAVLEKLIAQAKKGLERKQDS